MSMGFLQPRTLDGSWFIICVAMSIASPNKISTHCFEIKELGLYQVFKHFSVHKSQFVSGVGTQDDSSIIHSFEIIESKLD